ncbi:MAG: mechanosensitive ion channel family protein [Acidobacteria bacterium]|nr:mechanosensitive ion channel family protein [Acidobacteriota bacterium]
MTKFDLRKQFFVFISVAGIIIASLILLGFIELPIKGYFPAFFTSFFTSVSQGQVNVAVDLLDNFFRIVKIILWLILVVTFVRFINVLLFETLLRKTSSYEISALVRNIFTIIICLVAFFIILQTQYPSAYEKLAPIFTGSAIIGVVIGLALQDTLGNLFAGLAMQADQPFQIGDVVTIADKGSGVIENISWRGMKIRTFQNKLLIISNSVLGKEAIEVAPRDNLNARLVFFNTLYANSPAKTAQVIREVVRQVENVSPKMRPVVRVKNLGDNGIDWEIKYWIEDYSKFNDTDALVRQRIWYAFQREKIEFAYPTRTLHIETKMQENAFVETTNEIFERLSNVPIFAPLSDEETRQLAESSSNRVFAPGELIVRQGQQGKSMFVIHRGSVFVQIKEEGATKNIRKLHEGDFFGEMGLFTGEPRSATVVVEDETEVLEISNLYLKPILERNPELVQSFSQLIDERRAFLETLNTENNDDVEKINKAGVFDSIKKFFGLGD